MPTNNSVNIGVVPGGNLNYVFPNSSGTLSLASKVQDNVTASRALSTTYANQGTSSLLCMVTVRCAVTLAAGVATAQAKADTSSPPTTVVSGLIGIQAGLLNEDNTYQLMFVVGTSLNYRVDTANTNGTTVLGSFFECLM